MLYKAAVTEKETGRRTFVTSNYRYKKDFVRDLRNNGYRVDPKKVKEAGEFDRIIETTNCTDDDWKGGSR